MYLTHKGLAIIDENKSKRDKNVNAPIYYDRNQIVTVDLNEH
jgi:hypothetical protein